MPTLPDDWSPWIERLRADEPGALAILLQGSFARGEAEPYSDVDLRVVTTGQPRRRDRAYFVEQEGRLVHYSIGSRGLAELLGAIADAEVWPWLEPHYRFVKPVWDPHGTVELLRMAVAASRPGPRPYLAGLFLELESMIEEVAKVRNAEMAADYMAAARAARETADRAWRVLLRCVDPWPLENQAAGVERMLRLGDAIPGYRDNLLLCLGLTPVARPMTGLAGAALDLADGVVAWIEVNAARIGLPEDVRALLGDGQLARYLRQMRG
jgi:phosphoribosyl-AMP cyclohydrolase